MFWTPVYFTDEYVNNQISVKLL